MSDDDIFADLDGDAVVDPSPNSMGSTPLDFSGVVGQPTIASVVASSSASHSSGYLCPHCAKIIQTKSGFTRHVTLHRLNDYNSRKPMEEEIKSELNSMFELILIEISAEPAIGEMGRAKKKFVAELLPLVQAVECLDFINLLSEPIINCVLTRTKVMPSAQFEAALGNLNGLLANSDSCQKLKEKLLLCVPVESRNISNEIAQRLVWRISTLLMLKIQEFVFKKMKIFNGSVQSAFSMSEEHLLAFKDHTGSILRSIYRIGANSKNSVWLARCQALRERFVTGDNVSCENFLDRNLWESGSIVLSDDCVNLFLGLERLIQSYKGQTCTADIVFDSLTSFENHVLLNNMRCLSRGFLSEETALNFLQVIIRSFLSTSSRLEARKISSSKRADVALRHDLKRNPKKKTSSKDSGKAPTQAQASQARKESMPSTSKKQTSQKSSKKATTEVQLPQPCEDESTASTSRGIRAKSKNVVVAATDKGAKPSTLSRKRAKPTVEAGEEEGNRQSASSSKTVKTPNVTVEARKSSRIQKAKPASAPAPVEKPSTSGAQKATTLEQGQRRTRSSASTPPEPQIPKKKTR